MKKSLLIICLLAITSFVFSQSITITSPNGGQVYPGCTVTTITWNSSGTTDYYSIDYSTDNGTSWTSITSYYNTTTRTYNWTVPNTSSATCLIKITDSNNSVISDQSDAVFTVTSPLTVLAPNGGESWEAGTSHSITYSATGTSNYYDISYSTNAGSSWTTIANNVYSTSGTYNWNVPNTPSTTCLVKMKDHSNTCMSDISNGLFEITPASSSITISSPNGGEIWYVGQNKTISWSDNNTTYFYNIDYSTDNGLTWTAIASNFNTTTGQYSFVVPNTPSDLCLVRVTDANNVSVEDVSNSTFTIADPYITVIAPNGGETFESCEDEYINWQCGGTSNFFKIEYSIDNGATWTTITSSFYSSSSNPSYLWSTIPNNDSGNCLIRVTDKNNTSVLDQSDATFTISPNEDIIITSPNGGESWEVGSTQMVTWVAAPSSTRFYLYYSVNNGSSWTLLTNTTNNYYNWTIPDNESNQALFKVVDYYNACVLDESDANFTIAPPTPVISVTYPNSATTLYQNNSYNITWTSQYVESPFVTIDYSLDNGSSWNNISLVTENDGSFAWMVPAVLSSECLVRVSEYENPSVFDVSNTNFSIVEQYITVTYPNGGETWTGCDSRTITWSKGGISSLVKIEYSLDNGLTWSNVTSSTSSSGSYTWNPVTDLAGTECLVRVSDKTTTTINDQSDAVFDIVENNDIFVTSPNGGESLEVATTHTITWVSAPELSRYSLYYSVDNGATWTLISSSITSNSYNWTVPNLPSTECLIKVVDYYNTCIYDLSDSNFSIEPPTPVITLTYPNSGQTFYVENSYNITWTHQYDNVDFVKIDFSIDNGGTWQNIVAVTENDGTYTWNVPNMPSVNCLIRIYDVGDMSFIDECDMNFTIAPQYLTLTSPNGGETMTGCDSYNINWTRGGTTNYFRIEYSADNGVSWNIINSNYYSTSTNSTYTWNPIVNQSSNQFLVRVRDKNNLSVGDTCNAVFTVNPNTDIIVTSPNGGENWEIGDSHQITWVSASGSTRFNVFYSINNGANWITLTSNTSNNYYNWTIPNNPSNNCLVKVVDYNNSCIQDISDSEFSISEPAANITVNYPNSGQTLYFNQNCNITWSSEFTVSEFVTIEYSIDNGSTWSTIVSPTEDDGSYAWTVPATASVECLVRVSEFGNATVYDICDTNFTIAQPYVVVTYPNGGEIIDGCSDQTITWTRGGTTNYYKIEYSLDNGLTWNTKTNSTYNTSASYVWSQFADIGTTEALIRVSDRDYPIATDESDNAFTIIKNTDVVVLSPNGGESYEVGTSIEIDWISDPSVSRYYVYYSVNDGASWTLINSTYSSYYNWTIPDDVSNNCKIKVADYYNSCVFDVSDAVFAITPPIPNITVNYPNSSTTTLYIGRSANITWNSEYLASSFVAINYSYDGGLTWNAIATVTENDGSHNWTIPETPSSECLIKVSEFENASVFDVSDEMFTIDYPWIVVTSPNGGETYEACNSMTITWSRAGVSNTYKIEYSTNGGVNWTSITNSTYTTGTSYTWSTIANLNSSNCIVRVSDVNSPSAIDESNAAFTISTNNDIIVTTPNGGEFWEGDSSERIEWVSAPTSTRFYVYYSLDGGNTYTLINSTYSNYYDWSIPNVESSTCKIRVRDYYNSCIQDESDDYFAIIPPPFEVYYPNGGESLYYGSSYNITWADEYLYTDYVKIEFSDNNGASWSTIKNVEINDGSYSWLVPDNFSDECLIKVSKYDEPSVFDISNAPFEIKPSIVLNTPNGDGGAEVWRVCTETSITWNANGDSNFFKIEYSTDNGITWNTINSNYYSTSSNVSFNWTLPNTPSTECLVRVSDKNNLVKTDVSDATFTIAPAINIVNPNGGESIAGGSPYTINWTSDGVSNYYNIDYSTDGGSTWSNICFNQNIVTNSYLWSVPSVISQNCLIKITDNVNTCKTATSEQVFAIGTAATNITVTAPVGGEVWEGCTSETITWTSTGTSDDYNIFYSTDAGASWILIESNYYTLTKDYVWTIPNLSAVNAKIKVSDAANNNYYGTSPSVFELSTVVANAGNDQSVCAGSSVNLNATGGVTYSWLPSTGLSDPNIANPVASPSTTTTYTVFVTDANGCTQPDEIVVTVNAIPSAPVASSNSPVNLNGDIELTASTVNMAIYSWSGPNSFSSNQQNPIIHNAEPTMSGTYTVYATVAGCQSNAATTDVNITGVAATVDINGSVYTEIGVPVSAVNLALSGDGTDLFTTGALGNYDFTVDNGGSYVITPAKNNDVVTNNGVSTLDIILMQRHILNVQTLNSPYKLIAADVNRSEGISTLDIVLTRALILQTETSFPGGDLWSFVNSDFVFADPTSPWPYELTRSYSSATELDDQDFVGIKLGDVNNSWNTNIAKSTDDQLNLNLGVNNAISNQVINLPVYAENFTNLSGLQMTINWDSDYFEFVGVSSDVVGFFFGDNYSESGNLTAVWSTGNLDGETLSSNQVLFTIQLLPMADYQVSTALSITSDITMAEAYTNELEALDIILSNSEIEINPMATDISDNLLDGLNLNCHPNPFAENVKIEFALQNSAEASVQIINSLGEIVFFEKSKFISGLNQIIWDGNDANGNRLPAGTYYLKLIADEGFETQKLVIFR